jgi:hypothetical protein
MTDLWGSLLRRGLRLGLDRGLLGGSPPWLVLGALALLGYLLSRAMERHQEVVIRTGLVPGDIFEVTEMER